MRSSGLALILLTGLAACAAGGDNESTSPLPVKARASTDKAAIKIGERLNYTITIEADGTMVPALPDIPEKLGEFTVLDVKRDPPIITADGKTIARVTCLLTTYAVGKQFIPPTEIQYKLEDGKTGIVTTGDVAIDVESALAPGEKMDDIRDIKEIVPFGQTTDSLLFAGALLILLLMAIAIAIIIALRARRKTAAARALYAHEVALAELEKLRSSGLIAAGKIREFHYRLSGILRRYVEDRFSLRAPERTTEEFLLELAETKLLLTGHKSLLGNVLQRCDLAKFAKHRPGDGEIDAALDSVEALVRETGQEPVQREKHG